jgi:hypothetical protein
LTALVDRIPFTKIATILAIIAGVSLGLCGVGMGAFWLSILGLMLTLVVWIIAAIVKSYSQNR